jgi:phage tail sheath protein FI
MVVSPTYPGVYVQELPSGVHTLIGVATSITAFLGRTPAGPVNSGTTITSFADYQRTFGGLDVDYPLGYAVRDFFNMGGSQAVIVRLFNDSGAVAAAAVAQAAESSAGANPGAVATDATNAANAYTADPAKTAAQAVATAASEAAAAAGATLQTVKDAAAAAAAGITNTSSATGALAGGGPLQLTAEGPGTWGNDLYFTTDTTGITDQVATSLDLDQDLLFNLNIYYNPVHLDWPKLKSRGPDERLANVSMWTGAGAQRIDRILEQYSNLVTFSGETQDAKLDAQAPNFITPVPGTGEMPPRFTGGTDSLNLDQRTVDGDQDHKTGMYALEDVDLFNIVCLPLDETSDARKQIYSDVLEYCYQRRAILIVDPPPSWSNRQTLISNPLTKLQNDVALTGEEARNAFLYYPRVEMPDPLQGGQIKSFPACGLIAGVIARTDANRGVWTAPAGQDASLGAVTLEVKLSDRENGILNPVAINCLRTFPLVGTVIWGSRTLRGADQLADEYKYLPVRRTALYIEESLYRGSTWIVFQPNAEPLWAQIRLNFGAFMNDLFRKGAFQGARPQDAYFVRCDSSTTTQNDIDRGVVNIIVGFAPLKPAEFVVIELQQIAGQIQV